MLFTYNYIGTVNSAIQRTFITYSKKAPTRKHVFVFQ